MSPQQVIQCWLGFDLIHQDVGGSLRAVFDLLQNLPELFTIEVVPWQTKPVHYALPGTAEASGPNYVALAAQMTQPLPPQVLPGLSTPSTKALGAPPGAALP